MKNFLVIISLVFLGIGLTSCGGNKKTDEKKTVVSDSISPAIAALNAKIKANPGNAELYNQRALLLVDALKLDDALADIRTALNIDSTQAPYFLTLSDVYFAMGKIKNCKRSIEKTMALDPNYADADLKYAELNFYLNEYKTTLEYIDKALKIDKINAKAYFMKGTTYKYMGDTAKAVVCFQTAVDQYPEYYNAYMQLGLLYSLKKNPMAIDYFNNAIKQNAKSIEARYGIAMFYQENGQYDNAIIEYDTILRINPKYKYAHFNLGYIHLAYLGVYSQAVKHFTNAIACDTNYFEAYFNRGLSYEKMGAVLNARDDYKKALSLHSNYGKAIDGLNRVDKLIK